MHYQLELAGETATLYVAGGLGYESVSTLLDVCSALPGYVRTLRLDLHALGAMTAEATAAVRLLLHHWRDIRNGEFRLSTSYLVATCSEVTSSRAASSRSLTAGAVANDALTATFL